jgi:hypothetical protein
MNQQPFKLRHTQKLDDWHADFPDHTWVFWANPSQTVIDQLTGLYGYADGKRHDDTDVDQAIQGYYAAVSQVVLDSGESQIDFSSAESTTEAFTTHDGELLAGIIDHYLVWLFERKSAHLKKAEERLSATAGS